MRISTGVGGVIISFGIVLFACSDSPQRRKKDNNKSDDKGDGDVCLNLQDDSESEESGAEDSGSDDTQTGDPSGGSEGSGSGSGDIGTGGDDNCPPASTGGTSDSTTNTGDTPSSSGGPLTYDATIEGCASQGKAWVGAEGDRAGFCRGSLVGWCCTKDEVASRFPQFESALSSKYQDPEYADKKLYHCSTEGGSTYLHFATGSGNRISYKYITIPGVSDEAAGGGECPKVTAEDMGIVFGDPGDGDDEDEGDGEDTGGDPAWSELTDDATDLRAAVHYEADDAVYALVGNAISKWDGNEWSELTDPNPNLSGAFQFNGEGEIWATTGNTISLWDGQSWSQVTGGVTGLGTAFHAESENAIYAVTGNRISKWDGNAWDENFSTRISDLKDSIHFVADDDNDTSIYAVVGTEIREWDGAGWNKAADATDGLKPAIHVTGPDEIYAVIGTQICVWDGNEWTPVTDEKDDLKAAFHRSGDALYAVTGSKISAWK